MKNNYLRTFILVVILSLPWSIHETTNLKKYSSAKQTLLKNNLFFEVQKAFAVTELDPANMSLSTVAGRADFIRFLYFLVTGPTADYSIPNGPEGGMVGIIKSLMGAEGLGGGLYKMGYTTCESIPTTGSVNISDSEGTFVITFATPAKTIPSHYGSYGGGAFGKSVSISKEGTNMIKTEFNCESNGLNSGYVRFHVAEENRDIELYYLRDVNNSDGYMDFYITYTGSTYSEKVAVQFQTLDDVNYSLFLFRNQDNNSGNDEGAAFGLSGDSSSGLVKVHYIFDTNDSTLDNATAIGSASNTECISLVTNATSTGCSSVSTPTNVTLGAAFTWTIQSLNSLTLSTL